MLKDCSFLNLHRVRERRSGTGGGMSGLRGAGDRWKGTRTRTRNRCWVMHHRRSCFTGPLSHSSPLIPIPCHRHRYRRRCTRLLVHHAHICHKEAGLPASARSSLELSVVYHLREGRPHVQSEPLAQETGSPDGSDASFSSCMSQLLTSGYAG